MQSADLIPVLECFVVAQQFIGSVVAMKVCLVCTLEIRETASAALPRENYPASV